MRFRVDPRASVPPSQQIAEAVLDAISNGEFPAGGRLPSVRSLAESVLVNPNTVAKAYGALEALRVVEGRNGSGVFVREEGPARAGELRRAATLDGFRRAADEAVRAGHPLRMLEGELAAFRDPARAYGGTGGSR